MTAPTPNLKGLPNELIDSIFIAYVNSLDQSPNAMLDAGDLFLAFPDFENNIKIAIRLCNSDHTTITDFQFADLISYLNTNFKYLLIAFLNGKRDPKRRSTSGRVLYMNLRFSEPAKFDVQDLANGLAFFHHHDIFPRYTIHPPQSVHHTTYQQLVPEIGEKDTLAGAGLARSVAQKFKAILREVTGDCKHRKIASLTP